MGWCYYNHLTHWFVLMTNRLIQQLVDPFLDGQVPWRQLHMLLTVQDHRSTAIHRTHLESICPENITSIFESTLLKQLDWFFTIPEYQSREIPKIIFLKLSGLLTYFSEELNWKTSHAKHHLFTNNWHLSIPYQPPLFSHVQHLAYPGSRSPNVERERDGKRKNLKQREGPLASTVENLTSMLLTLLLTAYIIEHPKIIIISDVHGHTWVRKNLKQREGPLASTIENLTSMLLTLLLTAYIIEHPKIIIISDVHGHTWVWV